MKKHIYHITTKDDWKKALEMEFYEAPSLASEGFIHCCDYDQVEGVLDRYYKQSTNLLKLVLDADKLTHILKYELSPSTNEQFPHIYGHIHLEAIIHVEELTDYK